jgi:hypothetical protein
MKRFVAQHSDNKTADSIDTTHVEASVVRYLISMLPMRIHHVLLGGRFSFDPAVRASAPVLPFGGLHRGFTGLPQYDKTSAEKALVVVRAMFHELG